MIYEIPVLAIAIWKVVWIIIRVVIVLLAGVGLVYLAFLRKDRREWRER